MSWSMQPVFIWWLLEILERNDDLFSSVRGAMRNRRFQTDYTKAWAHYAERVILRRTARSGGLKAEMKKKMAEREKAIEGWDGKWTPDLSMEEYTMRRIARLDRKPKETK